MQESTAVDFDSKAAATGETQPRIRQDSDEAARQAAAPVSLTALSPLRPSIKPKLVPTSRKKRFTRWATVNFYWVVYITMILQLLTNVGIMTVIPATMQNEAIYLNIPMTKKLATSQCVPMAAPCLINQLLIGEWYFVRNRLSIQDGNIIGLVGMLLLCVTTVVIDAFRLIQAHFNLVELRSQDGKNETGFNELCNRTSSALANEKSTVILSSRRVALEQCKCCQSAAATNISDILAANYTFVCCNSACRCNQPQNGKGPSICLTKLIDEMSAAYSSTYPIYIAFVIASISSILSFLYMNYQISSSDAADVGLSSAS